VLKVRRTARDRKTILLMTLFMHIPPCHDEMIPLKIRVKTTAILFPTTSFLFEL